MKQCPNGHIVSDEAKFCATCGMPIPQENVCPHCGAAFHENDAFCGNCGRPIQQETKKAPIAKEGIITSLKDKKVMQEKRRGSKRFLPFIIIPLLLAVLAILLFYVFSDNNTASESKQPITSDSIMVSTGALVEEMEDNGANYDEDDITEEIQKLYTEAFSSINADEKFTSEEYHSLLLQAEKMEDEFNVVIDHNHWTQGQDWGDPTMTVYSVKKSSDDEAIAQIGVRAFGEKGSETRMKIAVVYENGRWVVDDFISIYDGRESSEKENLKDFIQERSNVNESETSKYVGTWKYYISSSGQRLLVYKAIINPDMTAEFISYMPDGSVNTSMSFNECVFRDGLVYFTDNGDTNIAGTLRFMLGPNGLQTAKGEEMVIE